MKNALASIGRSDSQIRPGRDAQSSCKGCNSHVNSAGEDYEQAFNRVIGGDEVRYSPEVASIIRRLELAEGRK